MIGTARLVGITAPAADMCGGAKSSEDPDPRILGAKCGECPLAKDGCAAAPVYPERPESVPLGVLLGEGPGAQEVREGRPFAGPTGDELNQELLAAGLVRPNLLVVNATLCRPPKDKSAGMMRKAVDCCRPAVDTLAKQHGATKLPTLAMGKFAGYYMCGKLLNTTTATGFVRDARWIFTVHPTYAFFYNPFEWGTFRNDLRKFARLVHGETRPPPEALIPNPTVEQFDELTARGPIAVDIETAAVTPDEPWTGLDPTRAKLKTIGFGNTRWGLAFPSPEFGGDPKLFYLAKVVIATRTTIWHNGPWFDHRVLRRYGFEIGKYEDTRDMRRALSASSPLRLGYLSTLYDDTDPWKEDEESDDAKGMILTKNLTKLLRYNAQDAVETARLCQGMATLRTDDTWTLVEGREARLYQTHKRLSEIAAKMHTHGFLINRSAQEQLKAELLALEASCVQEFKRVAKTEEEPSPNNMRALLFKRYTKAGRANFGVEDPTDPDAWSETGLIKVDHANLLNVLIDPGTPEEARRTIEAYWKAMAPGKALSTFVDSELIRQATGADGRVRAGWNSCGTDRGRFACSKPNLQNLPDKKKEEDGALSGDLPSTRRMYCAAPGWTLVHGDYSQLELHVRAAVTGDRALEEHLRSGDVYSLNAREWFGLPKDMDVKKLKPAARKSCKIIHLASQYAAGEGKIYTQALKQDRSFSFKLVKELHRGFLATYWRTVEWWKEEMARVRSTGYAESRILNRRLVYPRPPDITDIANYGIASTAADIAAVALVSLDDRIQTLRSSWRILTHEHDAFTMEAPEEDAAAASDLLRECMEQEFTIEGKRRRFATEIKVGYSWDKV